MGREVLGVVQDAQTSQHGITAIDWDCHGHFATGSFDTAVRVYKSGGNLPATLVGHEQEVFAERFSLSGALLATCSGDPVVLVWVVATGKVLRRLGGHAGAVFDADWRGDGTLATASVDCTVGRFGRVWRDGGEWAVLRGHDTGVLCVKWVPQNDRKLASSAQNGSICIWDAVAGACLIRIQRSPQEVLSLSMAPNGAYMAAGTGHVIDVVDVETGEQIAVFKGKSQIFEVSWDPTGKFIAAGFGDTSVTVIPMAAYLRP
jgi:WD40 repeat protein